METQNRVTSNNTLCLSTVIQNWQKASSNHAFGDVELSFSLIEITPQIAELLLLTQSNNRNVSQSRVLDYARRLESGDWTLSDAIKFDFDGHLIDGQHRLCAIKKSGIAALFPVICGYPSESQSVLDIGLNRTVAQIGQIEGLGVTSHHISMVRSLFLTQASGVHHSLSSPQKVLRVFRQHQEAIDFALRSKAGHGIRYSPVRAMVARAWYHENRKRLEEFLYVFDTGFAQGVQDSAAVCLRNKYKDSIQGRRSGGQEVRKDFAQKTVSAIEAFLAGEERKAIRSKTSCKWKLEGVD